MSKGKVILDDINSLAPAIAEFEYDIYENFGLDPDGCEDVSLTLLDAIIQRELDHDVMHQHTEWIIRDKAWEAIGLVESDGANIGSNGVMVGSYEKARLNHLDSAYINLVRTNRDRIVSQLEATNLGIQATPQEEEYREATDAINKVVDTILEKNTFEGKYLSAILDSVTYGSGVLLVEYNEWMTDPNKTLDYTRILSDTGEVSFEDLASLKQSLYHHTVEYVDTFDVVRYRGARGRKAADMNDPVHRWVHKVSQIPISLARQKYPNYADSISPGQEPLYAKISPYYDYFSTQEDMITEHKVWVRVPVEVPIDIMVQDPTDPESLIPYPIVDKRYCIVEITRLTGVGIVNITYDKYFHNRIPLSVFTYTTSSRHGCGIGAVKYGRDAQIIHNKLHNSMLEFFRKMAKGGGFVDGRLGLTSDQLEDRSKSGTYTIVNPPAMLQNAKLSDLIVDTRPSSMPSVFPEMLGWHAGHVDSTMSVPNASKGIKEGASGRQELVLQRQAESVHTLAISMLEQSYAYTANLIVSNVVQFEREPFTFNHYSLRTGEQSKVMVNMPTMYEEVFDPETHQTSVKPTSVINDIQNARFDLRVATQTIVPTRPSDRATFYANFYQQTAGFIGSPQGRIWLRHMNQNGFNIPGITEALHEIDEFEREMMEAQQQSMQQEQERVIQEGERKAQMEDLELMQNQQQLDQQLG